MPPTQFERETAMPVGAQALYDWHARPAAFFRLVPPFESVEVVAIDGPFGDGQRVSIRASVVGPVGKTWLAELFEVVPGVQFRDRQLKGPFAEWTHTHSFAATSPTTSTLRDSVEYSVPLGPLGRLFGGGLVRSKLDAMFRFRHAITRSDLARDLKLGGPRLTMAVTGSNGVIGRALCPMLGALGHRVIRLVRSPEPKPRLDGSEARVIDFAHFDAKALDGVDAVIHLAGDGVAEGRWTAAKKERIRSSRVGPTLAVARACAGAGVKTLLSGSAVGIYGSRGDEVLSESARHGGDFLAEVSNEWEAATKPAEDAGARVVHLRTGVVLTPTGGALAKQLPAFKAGGGAVLGDGKQYLSWISLDDEVAAIHHCLLTPTVAGPVNLVAPNPATNREFGRALASVLGRPFALTLPGAALRLMFGELADAALLASQRAVPGVLQGSGFEFLYPTLDGALRAGLGKVTSPPGLEETSPPVPLSQKERG